MSRGSFTDEDIAYVFHWKKKITSRKLIKYGIKRYGITFEDSRNLLYGSLDRNQIRLTVDWHVERLDSVEDK